MAFTPKDEQIDGHDDLIQCAAGDRGLGSGGEVVDDDSKVQVAVGAEVAAGAGAEGDDADGVGYRDDALNGGKNLLLGDAGIELEGRGRHSGSSLYL